MTEEAQNLRRLSGTAELRQQGDTSPLDMLEGTEAERGVDISSLRSRTGLVTYDPALANTAGTASRITYLDGERGILRYRGYSIEDLAERASFVETAYLLIYGELPSQEDHDSFSQALSEHSLLHEDMKRFYDGYPMTAHPMAILSAMVNSLSTFYPEAQDALNLEERERTIVRLLSKLRTIAACA